MKKLPNCVFVWDGQAMIPTLHFALLAESSFTSGNAYRLIVAEENETIRRSNEQNKKMWSLLAEISEKVPHCGHRYTADEWKTILMHACGHEVQFLPALDRKTFVPYGGRSSKMTVAQMAEFIEYIYAFAASQNVKFRADKGVTWNDEETKA